MYKSAQAHCKILVRLCLIFSLFSFFWWLINLSCLICIILILVDVMSATWSQELCRECGPDFINSWSSQKYTITRLSKVKAYSINEGNIPPLEIYNEKYPVFPVSQCPFFLLTLMFFGPYFLLHALWLCMYINLCSELDNWPR